MSAPDPRTVAALAEPPPPTNAPGGVLDAWRELVTARENYRSSARASSTSFEGSSISQDSESAARYLAECHEVYRQTLAMWQGGCGADFDPVTRRGPMGHSFDFSALPLSC